MKQAISALARLIGTLAAVAIVVVVHRPVQGDQASADTVLCELNPPRDLAGLEACLARSPHDVELLLDLGAAYVAAGRIADARERYARAVALDPRDADARRRLDGLRP